VAAIVTFSNGRSFPDRFAVAIDNGRGVVGSFTLRW
jgi:hypothetical protein